MVWRLLTEMLDWMTLWSSEGEFRKKGKEWEEEEFRMMCILDKGNSNSENRNAFQFIFVQPPFSSIECTDFKNNYNWTVHLKLN